jgi:acyl carrier protein
MLSLEDLRQWLAEKTAQEPASIGDEAPIFTTGLLDSFDLIELVTFVEQRTGKRVKPLDINMRNFNTVSDIVAFSGRLLGK